MNEWDSRAEEAPKLHTGVGNPLDPYNDELLSEYDEKRLDDKGRAIVAGEPWSSVPTGYYLWSALWVKQDRDLRQLVDGGSGQTDIDLNLDRAPWNLSMGLSLGKPRFNLPSVGACLEIPSDLGDDSLKQKYVGEWLVETVIESLDDRKLSLDKRTLDELAVKVSVAADIALGRLL